jgi:hypothetical protein
MRRAVTPRRPITMLRSMSHAAQGRLTTLEQDHCTVDLSKPGPVQEASHSSLQADSCDLAADISNQSPRQNTTPPGLNFYSCSPKLLVFLDSHPPAHVLLYNSDQIVEAIRPKRLESGQHARSEENLCESTLVSVWVVNRLLQDSGAQFLELQVLDQRCPI